jgi:hypothetical protein
VNEDDIRKISPAYEAGTETEHQTEISHPDGRRFALGNIFNGVTEDDVLRIMSLCEIETDEGDSNNGEENTDRQTFVNTRRGALGNIFKDVDQQELTKILSDICSD